MAHVHTTDGDHDITVSGYIIRVIDGTPKMLLHPHKKLNTLLYIGGHVETNENPWQAIEHEIREESGYDLHDLQLLQPVNHIQPQFAEDYVKNHPIPATFITTPYGDGTPHFHSDLGYAFLATKPPKNSPAPDEQQKLMWLSAEEIRELPADALFSNVRTVALYVLEYINQEWKAA